MAESIDQSMYHAALDREAGLSDVIDDLNRLIEEQRDDLRACGRKVDRLLRQADDLQSANDKLREELRRRA